MSFSDAPNKAKAVTEAEKVLEGGAPRAQTTTAYRPRKTEEEEEDDEVDLRVPGSFDFGNQGGGAGCETPGAGTVDPFDAVGMLANLWRRMQVR